VHVAWLISSLLVQIKSGSYDGASNRELLKLYAVAPDMIRLVAGRGRGTERGSAADCRRMRLAATVRLLTAI